MKDVDLVPPMKEAHIVIQTTFFLALAERLIDAISHKAESLICLLFISDVAAE